MNMGAQKQGWGSSIVDFSSKRSMVALVVLLLILGGFAVALVVSPPSSPTSVVGTVVSPVTPQMPLATVLANDKEYFVGNNRSALATSSLKRGDKVTVDIVNGNTADITGIVSIGAQP